MLSVDPDLWLYTRLTIGRGRRLATTLALWTAGVAFVASGWIFRVPFLAPPVGAGALESPPLALALFVLLNAPALALARLLDLDRDGRLDHTRLTGRPPVRVLAGFLAGSTWPLVMLAAVLIVHHLRLDGDARALYLAVVVFASALAVALLLYGGLPPSVAPDSRVLLPLQFIFGFAAFYTLNTASWVERLAFDDPAAVLTMAAVALLLPAGVGLARRRLVRPWLSDARRPRLVGDFASWSIPPGGLAEFDRQLRRTLRSGGPLAIMMAAPLLVVSGVAAIDVTASESAALRLALNAIPYAVILIGAFAVSMTARREIDSRTVEFVRLTPQTPERVALEWYAALALPFWAAMLLAVAALAWLAPSQMSSLWPLVAIGAVLPAMGLAEGTLDRRPSTYVSGLFSIIMLIPIITAMLRGSRLWFWSSRIVIGNRWDLDARVVLPLAALALAIGAAAGRLRRPQGPALEGGAAIAGVASVALLAGAAPAPEAPRVMACLLVLLASFVAQEGDTPARPAWSVVVLALGAFVLAGFEAALALAVGVLIHERFWRISGVSLGLRLVAGAAILAR